MIDFTQKQKAEMARFMFSVLNVKPDCAIHIGNNAPGGKCYLQAVSKQTGKESEIFECMAVAFTPDGNNAFGITFDGDFVFFTKDNVIAGSPIYNY
jgi:hypothetical protein